MRRLFVALPAALAALPLWLLSAAIVAALRAEAPMERRTAERITPRFPGAALTLSFLSAAALIGALALLASIGERGIGDWLCPLGALLETAAGLLCFRLRKKLETGKV